MMSPSSLGLDLDFVNFGDASADMYVSVGSGADLQGCSDELISC
jgi:hypothetical protein